MSDEKGELYEKLTFANNFLFCKILSSNKELCKELIRIITGRVVKDITPPRMEATLKETIGGKGIRLDVVFADDENTVYNIEMQTTSNESLAKRTRYYQGLMDTSITDQGVDYAELPRSLIVFICTFDPFEAGRHVYTFENRCLEDASIVLGDETRKVFLSTEGTTNDVTVEMKQFLDFVAGRSVEGEFAQALQEEVQKARKNEKWRREFMQNMAHMWDFARDKVKKAEAEGREEGREEGLRWMYRAVEDGDMTAEKASQIIGVSIEQFKNNMLLTGHAVP